MVSFPVGWGPNPSFVFQFLSSMSLTFFTLPSNRDPWRKNRPVEVNLTKTSKKVSFLGVYRERDFQLCSLFLYLLVCQRIVLSTQGRNRIYLGGRLDKKFTIKVLSGVTPGFFRFLPSGVLLYLLSRFRRSLVCNGYISIFIIILSFCFVGSGFVKIVVTFYIFRVFVFTPALFTSLIILYLFFIVFLYFEKIEFLGGVMPFFWGFQWDLIIFPFLYYIVL